MKQCLATRNSKKVYILVKDNKKLKKVVINGKSYTSLKKRKATSGSHKGYYVFSSSKKGKNTVEAYDAAGNVKKGKLHHRVKKYHKEKLFRRAATKGSPFS